jgi:DNA-binding response OmpR family regulator
MRSARIVPTSRLSLNGTCARLPVIGLTAQSGESEEKALDLGAQDYLTTAVQTRSLAARVRAALKRINTCSGNYLPDDLRPWPPRAGAAPKPSLACFLPPER